MRFSVSMSDRTCSTMIPPVSTLLLASPKNMNASSESGLCATVMRVSGMNSYLSGKESIVSEGTKESFDRGRAVDVDVGGHTIRRRNRKTPGFNRRNRILVGDVVADVDGEHR